MEIKELQRLIVEAVNNRYSKWDINQRLNSLHKQVADVFYTHQVGQMDGITIQTRIADIFVDLFMICDEFDVDLDKEFKFILDWFKQEKPTTYENKENI